MVAFLITTCIAWLSTISLWGIAEGRRDVVLMGIGATTGAAICAVFNVVMN